MANAVFAGSDTLIINGRSIISLASHIQLKSTPNADITNAQKAKDGTIIASINRQGELHVILIPILAGSDDDAYFKLLLNIQNKKFNNPETTNTTELPFTLEWIKYFSTKKSVSIYKNCLFKKTPEELVSQDGNIDQAIFQYEVWGDLVSRNYE